MRTWIALVSCACATLFVAACAGPQDQGSQPAGAGKEIAAGDVCPATDPAKPDACPEGCVYNGTECRANRPIVIFDRPAPTSTGTAPTQPPTQPPVQPPSSGP